ncbi:MAG TPA: hypothetical protein VMB03_26870 [Bryobacteraceae bacterium]|nr:hypothetical protein [Bryobacteraceae bacterium]
MLTHPNCVYQKRLQISLLVFLAAASEGYAQLSSSAYRALGQPNLSQNGLNLIQGAALHNPDAIALDSRGAQVHLYVSDTQNYRVLGWADVSAYQAGQAPAIVLGQSSLLNSVPMGIGAKGFDGPLGLAVDPMSGNLYVADTGNNRVLRFQSPFDNPTVVEPDAVYGQSNFTTFSSAAPSATSLNQPRSLAFDPSGNLWIADTGNNRVVRIPAANLNVPAPVAADTVIGQKDFSGGQADAGSGAVSNSGFDEPAGIAFDVIGDLYVADFNNTRVLMFPVPLTPPAAASIVWGQTDFTSRGVPSPATSSSLAGPTGVSVGGGNLYVATPFDDRVLVFSAGGPNGTAAKSVIGQPDLTTTTVNTGSFPLASATSLAGPTDVKVDTSGNVWVADAENNRVLMFPPGSNSASQVWGQNDFASNGPNQVKPASLNFPYQVAIDYSQSPFALYVSDTNNNRVLVWKDSAHFQSGDPADLVIGQPTLYTAAPNIDSGAAQTPTATSLAGPRGVAVAKDGTVYVADSGNNRVLQFPRPVSQSGRITPSAVIGQTNFTSSASAATSATSLNTPGGLAIGPNGDLFVADSGNNRVLEFPPGGGTGAAAARVFGQPNMTSGTRPTQVSAQSLNSPQGVFVDQTSNLYVTDTGANRVLVYSNSAGSTSATAVIGQADSNGTPGGVALNVPLGVAVDGSGNVWVADNGNNRVLEFTWPGYLPGGATAAAVIGQPNSSNTSPDWDTTNGLATADSLYNPSAVYLDRQNTLYVGDPGNNRLLQFLRPVALVNGATLQAGVPLANGSIATLFGNGLATDTGTASGGSWPPSMVNRQVVVNDQLVAPLYYASATQMNFQLPSNTPQGQQRIAVRLADTNELVAGGSVLAAAVAPGIFTLTESGSGQAAVLNADYSVNGANNPAAIGSTIQIYGTGQGPVSPAVPDGTAAPGSPLSWTAAQATSNAQTCFATQAVCVAIGDAFGAIQYTGLAPGEIGLWQINVTIPSGIVTGSAVGVRVVIDGVASNLVTIAVK